MLHLFFAVISAAAPLTLYVSPMRNLSRLVETMELLFRPTISYMLSLLPNLRRAIARFLSPELLTFGRFSPEALNWLLAEGLVDWCLQVILLKATLFTLDSGEAPLLDIVAYAGYTFTGLSLAILGKIVWYYSYYFLMPWTCLCKGIFLVKTLNRVLFAEVRSYNLSRHHYFLLLIALAQFPLFIWLGNISLNWLF